MRGVTDVLLSFDQNVEFQPALPMRGVTRAGRDVLAAHLISTRTPHAGSDGGKPVSGARGDISTRTPHAGSDERSADMPRMELISTRTPHAGSDCNIMCKFTASINI